MHEKKNIHQDVKFFFFLLCHTYKFIIFNTNSFGGPNVFRGQRGNAPPPRFQWANTRILKKGGQKEGGGEVGGKRGKEE